MNNTFISYWRGPYDSLAEVPCRIEVTITRVPRGEESRAIGQGTENRRHSIGFRSSSGE